MQCRGGGRKGAQNEGTGDRRWGERGRRDEQRKVGWETGKTRRGPRPWEPHPRITAMAESIWQ